MGRKTRVLRWMLRMAVRVAGVLLIASVFTIDYESGGFMAYGEMMARLVLGALMLGLVEATGT